LQDALEGQECRYYNSNLKWGIFEMYIEDYEEFLKDEMEFLRDYYPPFTI